MKPLVVYYSLTGNTEFIAQNIAAETGADIMELKPFAQRVGSMLFPLKCFLQVLLRQKPRIRSFERNPNSYDFIFIGTPVWAGSFAPAVRSMLQKIDVREKKVAVFCCHSGRIGRAMDDLKELLYCSDIEGEKSFYRPLTFEKARNAGIARAWAGEMIARAVAVAPLEESREGTFAGRNLGRCVNF